MTSKIISRKSIKYGKSGVTCSFQLNNKPTQINEPISMEELMLQQNISLKGIAVALNQTIVNKSDWKHKIIKENDSILIITATQGG